MRNQQQGPGYLYVAAKEPVNHDRPGLSRATFNGTGLALFYTGLCAVVTSSLRQKVISCLNSQQFPYACPLALSTDPSTNVWTQNEENLLPELRSRFETKRSGPYTSVQTVLYGKGNQGTFQSSILAASSEELKAEVAV